VLHSLTQSSFSLRERDFQVDDCSTLFNGTYWLDAIEELLSLPQ